MATPKWYTLGMQGVMGKVVGGSPIDLDTDTIKLMLATSSYTPSQTADDFRNDVSANEASGGSGYTAGGFTLASSALSISSLTINFDSADISQAITGGPFAFRYGVFYKSVGTAATDPLIAYVDFGAQSITDATLTITLTNQLGVTVS